MKDTDIIEDKFGEIELKLLKDKVLKDVADILHQVSDKDENFLYQAIKHPMSKEIVTKPFVKGEFMGHKYEICTNGIHPTAYVTCGYFVNISDKEVYDSLPVHGGCTFIGTRANDYLEDIKGGWVGWDYGHSGDFMKPPATEPHNDIYFGYNKKWTVAEVMEDVIKAISFIENIK